MKPHSQEWAALQHVCRFLLCSQGSDVARRVGEAVSTLGMVMQDDPSPEALAGRLAELRPRAVFLDFIPDPDDAGKLARAAELAHQVSRFDPKLPRIAIGRFSKPESAVAALRAGVSDFADVETDMRPGDSFYKIVQGLLHVSSQETLSNKAMRSVVLLGTRAGVGCSTLAVHLAALAQDMLASAAECNGTAPEPAAAGHGAAGQPALRDRVGMLDLGMPAGDCLLYLNTSSEFDFVEAVRNLHRLDGTMLASAVAHTSSGVSVLALPQDLDQLRGVSHADSLYLYERLREYFGGLITDAGGLANFQFLRSLVSTADETWLVTDQSVGALVSLGAVLKELEGENISGDRLHLVVNRYDERYGMSAAQIAERFGLNLRAALPDRRLTLHLSANRGRLLHQDFRRDPYVRGVRMLADALCTDSMVKPGHMPGRLARWLPRLYSRSRT